MRVFALSPALLALAAACGSEAPVASPPLPVSVAPVAGTGDGGGLRYSASITPEVQVEAAFKVTGYVEQLRQVRDSDGRLRPIQEGDYVTRGTVLARVREREYRDALTQAEAALTRSRADFARTSQLYENRSASKADYDAAVARFRADQAERDRAAQTLADCALVAPLDGVVLRRSVEVGTLASPGVTAFSIGRVSAVRVVFGVPDVVVGGVRAGARQRVTVEAVPGQVFEGRFTRVAPAADATSRMFEVEVTIPNPGGQLRPGMIAALRLEQPTGPARPTETMVPLHAVIRPPGRTTGFAVFVVDSLTGIAVARLRPVELGDLHGNQIQVTAGLEGGERVIVRGATLAVDARPVRIIP